jgi:type I restriction enzyme S subunit
LSEWREIAVADLAASVVGGPFGSSLGRKDYVDAGVPVIRGAQLSLEGGFSLSDLVFVTDAKADRHSGNLAFPGDVIVTQRGTLGQVGLVPFDSEYPRFLLSQSQMKITVDPNKADPLFIYYSLRHPDNRRRLLDHAMSAGVPHINLATLREFRLSIPSIEVQRASAAAIRAFDDLIENNRRRIALLEQMAQAIYREWFVHFRYPGHEDDELVDSPLGPVPTRFDIAPLGACCNINREQRRPERDEEIVYIDISALGDRTVALPSPIPGSDAPGRARRVLSDGDVVWSMVRPGRRAHALLVKAKANWIGSTGLAVISPNGVPPSFVFEFVSTSMFSDYLVGKEQGAAYPAVRPIDFKQAQTAVPPEEVLCAFDDVVSPIHGLGWELEAQARAAAQLRDLLLPKLVTGAIDVSKLELDALVEESAA